MPVDYIAAIRTQAADWWGLHQLWVDHLAGRRDPIWQQGLLLEHVVLRAFELDTTPGIIVTWPYRVEKDGAVVEQIDGVVHLAGLSCLIECKDTQEPTNIEPIAKLRNQLLRRPAMTIGMVMSRSGFTAPAQTLAQFLAPQTILLWLGDELTALLARAARNNRGFMVEALQLKLRTCVEQGISDLDVTDVFS